MSEKHILVVDDEPKLAFFLGKALEQSNQDCRVSVANSGEEALRVVSEESPVNLLITDLRMPGINGLELMNSVRQKSPDTRLILMTAFGSAEVEETIQKFQVSRYLTKPFHLRDLLVATKKILADLDVSQGGELAVSEPQFEAMSDALSDLRQSTGLECALLADPIGQVLLTDGSVPDVPISTLLALFAGSFATDAEVARHLKDSTPRSLRYYEGKRYEMYMINVGTALLLLLIGVRTSRSRLGTVWHYSQRTAETLEKLVSDGALGESGMLQEDSNALDDGFGESFMAELDSALDEPQSAAAPAPTSASPPAATNNNSNNNEVLSYEEAMARGLIDQNLEQE